jgi:hypothetical protein
MPGEVNVPEVGKTKKSYVVIGLVVAAGGAYYLYKKRQTAAATAAAATTAATLVTDPAGMTCAALDVNTGYCPGTAQDLAAGGGSGSYQGNTTTTQTGNLNPNSGPGSFTSNGQWAQYAINYMTNGGTSANFDAVSSALGKAESGQCLQAAELSIYQQAIGVAGSMPNPPAQAPSLCANQTPPANGTCNSGDTWSATQTSASGEYAATGGAGWCELVQPLIVPGTPPTGVPTPQPAPAPGVTIQGGYQTYAPGGKTLTQIAAAAGVTVAQLSKIDPGVVKKYGTGKVLPAGTGLYVPKH